MGLIDFIKNKSKGKVKKLIFNAVKPVLIKLGIIVTISILVIILLASAWYNINETVVSKTSSTIRNNGEEPSVTVNYNSRQYNLDTEFSKRVEKVLESLSINLTSKGLSQELIEKMYKSEIMTSYPDLRERNKIGTPIGEKELQGCIQFKRNYPDGQAEILEYMEFDKFRTELAKFGYDLQDSEGNSISVGKVYLTKAQVDSNYQNIRRYFTLDEEYNAIIAILRTDEYIVNYSNYAKEEGQEDNYSYSYYLDIKKINYKPVVEKYAMPLEFTLSILAVTENPGFCNAILDLVKDSKIVVEIQDNTVTTTTVEKYDYDAYFNINKELNYKRDIEVEIEDSEGENQEENEGVDEQNPNEESEEQNSNQGNQNAPTQSNNRPNSQIGNSQENEGENSENEENSDEESEEDEPRTQIITVPVIKRSHITNNHYKLKDIDNNPYKKQTMISIENSINLCVTEAKTWILEAETIYTKNENVEEKTDSVTLADDENYTKVDDRHSYLANHEVELEDDAYDITVNSESYIEEKQTNKENKKTTTTKTITYTKTSSKVEEKEERFLSLLAVNPKTGIFDKTNISKNTKLIKYEDVYGRKTSPEDNLLSSTHMLFDLLSLNGESQNCEETMRYLLYIYTGKSYGVTTLDFSIYESEFNSINAGMSNINGIQGQIYNYLVSKGMSGIGAVAVLGNIERESSFNVSAINQNNPHYGLCQWGGSRFESLKSEAAKVGKTWEDLQLQLDFSWLELNTTHSSTGEDLMNATDLYLAVESFVTKYEICENQESEIEIRYQYAEKWYKLVSQNSHDGVNDIQKYNLNIFNGFIEYKQLDYTVVPPAYQATSSPAGTIKDKGCMPTSISIILSGMGVKDAFGNAYTPETLISTGTIAHINGGSSTSANAQNTFRKCGLTASGVRSTSSAQAKNDILSNLNAGNPLLIHASEGYYTGEGHLMTLIGVQGDQVYLSNPGNRNKTGWVSLTTLISRNVDWYMVVSR